MVLLLALLAFVSMFIFSYLLIDNHFSESDTMALRLKDVAINENSPNIVIEEEMAPSFFARVIVPFFGNISNFFLPFFPGSWATKLERKLILANGFLDMNYVQFSGFCVLLGLVFSLAIGTYLVIANKPIFVIVSLSLLLFSLGSLVPLIILEHKIKSRKTILRQGLPDVLDLLTVSVEAGLGFDGALVKLSEKMKGAMVDEFTRMLQEIRMGIPRRDALRALAERCDVDDVTLFTSALVQADQLGVSIGNVLRVQSVDMREKRRQRAEEQAMKAPIKMLFPLVFLIFPALFIVLLGSAALQIIATLSSR